MCVPAYKVFRLAWIGGACHEYPSPLGRTRHCIQPFAFLRIHESLVGVTRPIVSARRTEQALLQVINAAEQTLFITSFVAYDVSTIVKALNAASDRGVVISMLLELSQDHGGSITFDAIGKMRMLVPAARLYAWRDKADPFSDGRVHAKVAVADGRLCFITSANLTGHAMEKNMEAGVLISGGRIAKLLDDHLRSLVDTKVISPA